MPDIYLTRRQIVLAKVETTEGTDAAPEEANSGDAVKLVDPATLTTDQEFTEVVGGNLSRGYSNPILGARPISITYRTYVTGVNAGSYTANNKPPLHASFRACGLFETFVESDAQGESYYKYEPATHPSSDVSLTIVFHQDGFEHRMVSCRGNMNLIYAANAPIIAEFTMNGQLTTEAATTRSAPTGLTTVNPPKWIASGSVLIDSVPCLSVENFNLNTNNTVYEERSACADSGSGINRIILTERAPGGSLDPAATDISTHNAWGLFRSGSPVLIKLIAGTAAGNKIMLTGSNAYYKALGWGDKSGLSIWNTDYQFYETSADDEVQLAFITTHSEGSAL